MRNVIGMLAVVSVLSAGCSGSTAQPAPPAATGGKTVSLGPLPPVPARSLDTAKYSANPCDLLDKADLGTLGFADPYMLKPSGPEFKYPSCKAVGGSAGGELQLELKGDIESLRAAHEDTSGKYEFLHAVELRTFPGVVRSHTINYPGTCEVFIATGKEQALELSHLPGNSKGGAIGICGRLMAVAESVLRKLGA